MVILILSMVVPTIVVGGCLYYFIFAVMAEQVALPDIIARDILPIIHKINVILGVVLPVVFGFLMTWALILSYKFVAPLERLEEDIQKIDEGDYSVRLQVSRDHDLGPIAEVINDLVDKLEKGKAQG